MVIRQTNAARMIDPNKHDLLNFTLLKIWLPEACYSIYVLPSTASLNTLRVDPRTCWRLLKIAVLTRAAGVPSTISSPPYSPATIPVSYKVRRSSYIVRGGRCFHSGRPAILKVMDSGSLVFLWPMRCCYPGRWINYRTGAVVLIAQEQWPPKAFILCLTNDLIWWIPFGLYLYDAWKPFIADVEDLHTNT